jgi:3-phenylpropionate/cinnamic acid dioxygenase small subunit
MQEYAYRLDSGDFAGFAELYRNGRWQNCLGYDETLAWLTERVRLYEGLPRTSHLVGNVSIRNVDNDKATALSYITVLQQPDAHSPISIMCVNRYHDTFARTEGTWHFKDRQIERVLRGDMSGHLRSPERGLQ